MFASRGRNSGGNALRQTRRQPGGNPVTTSVTTPTAKNSGDEKQRRSLFGRGRRSVDAKPDPGIGTGHEGKTVRQPRLRTTRTVDCVAWRMKTCGPQA